VIVVASTTDRQRELRNVACIVGVDESDEIGTLPQKSQLSLHLEAISNAVRDAGLKVSDVDGVFTAGQHSPATLGEALGVKPRYVDGTTVGGCSFIIMVGHAVAALHHGLCDVAVVSHGESGRSGTGVTRSRDTALSGQFEFPYGFGGATSYFGMITTRHMHDHGTTLEQWAQVAVSTRKWAALNRSNLSRATWSASWTSARRSWPTRWHASGYGAAWERSSIFSKRLRKIRNGSRFSIRTPPRLRGHSIFLSTAPT